MHPDTSWRTPIHSGAPRCILAHPDDPSDHRGAIPDHRDAVLDGRKPSSDPRKGLRPDLERRKRAPEPILDTPDAVSDQNLDTLDVREGAPDCIGVIQNASGCILNHRDDPKLHRGAFLNHRDDPKLHRDDPKDIREDAKTVRDDPETVRDDPGTARDDPELAPDGPRDVREDPKSDREDAGTDRDDPRSDRDDSRDSDAFTRNGVTRCGLAVPASPLRRRSTVPRSPQSFRASARSLLFTLPKNRIPRLKGVALEWLAEHDGRSVDDALLARHLPRPHQRALRVAAASDPGLRRGTRVAVAGIRAWPPIRQLSSRETDPESRRSTPFSPLTAPPARRHQRAFRVAVASDAGLRRGTRGPSCCKDRPMDQRFQPRRGLISARPLCAEAPLTSGTERRKPGRDFIISRPS